MSHARQQIRDAVVSTLTGLSATGARVFASRVYPLTEAQLPGLCVYTTNELSDLVSRTTILREVQVRCEIYVKAVDGYDDAVDDIAADIEAAISANAPLQTMVKDIHVTATDKDLLKEGNQVICVGMLTFGTKYTTSATDPETLT